MDNGDQRCWCRVTRKAVLAYLYSGGRKTLKRFRGVPTYLASGAAKSWRLAIILGGLCLSMRGLLNCYKTIESAPVFVDTLVDI